MGQIRRRRQKLNSKSISKAAQYLQDWLTRTDPQKAPPNADAILDMLANVSRLADQEWADLANSFDEGQHSDAEFNSRKQAIWAVIATAFRAALSMQNENALAVEALRDGLVNLAGGVPDADAHGFSHHAVQSLHTIDSEWDRARVIAALQARPDKREEILRRGARLLGIDRAGVLKLAENFRGGLVGTGHLRQLVGFAKNAISEGETFPLDDLV